MTNPITGEKHQLAPVQVMELAEYGLMQASKNMETVNKDDKDNDKVETPENRIAKLEETIKEMEESRKREKQSDQILGILDKAAAKFDLTKENEKVLEKIKIITLTKLHHNPRLNPEEIFAGEVKDYLEMLGKGKDSKSNELVKNALTSTMRGGGVPLVDKNKEFKAVDLKSNASRRALEGFLNQLSSSE